VVSGCVSRNLHPTSVQTETHALLPTPVSLTATPIPRPTQNATLTPPATLEPAQAQETIQALLREPVDCDAPCFWGVVPGQTTVGEAQNIFIRLGLQITLTNARDQKKFYEIDYDFANSFSVLSLLTSQNDIVENLRIYITPEKQVEGVPREWLSYSPETLIRRYGTPSKVDFFFGGSAPNTSYAMDMYFDSNDLIIEYYSYDLGPNLQVCPLTDQVDSVRIWMGKNPENPPPDAILLEKATFMTMEEFTELMTRDPNEACFNLNVEAFQ